MKRNVFNKLYQDIRLYKFMKYNIYTYLLHLMEFRDFWLVESDRWIGLNHTEKRWFFRYAYNTCTLHIVESSLITLFRNDNFINIRTMIRPRWITFQYFMNEHIYQNITYVRTHYWIIITYEHKQYLMILV